MNPPPSPQKMMTARGGGNEIGWIRLAMSAGYQALPSVEAAKQGKQQ